MNDTQTTEFVSRMWDRPVVPTLCDFVHLPNRSPSFDPGWEANGHVDAAVDLLAGWCRRRRSRMEIEVLRIERRTPLLWIDVPCDADGKQARRADV